MIILISGATHTGKTLLSQKLIEKYKYPCFSIDHLKMGLIRSGQTSLTPMDDDKLTDYLWPIVREIIKTAIENNQNLIIEGCYIPFDFQKDFSKEYLDNIKHVFLIMSEEYINNHFDDIEKYENVIENRLGDFDLSKEELIIENKANLDMCQRFNLCYILIDKKYDEEKLKNI